MRAQDKEAHHLRIETRGADELVEIDYSHIPYQTVLMPSVSKVVRLDIDKRGNNIGYIECSFFDFDCFFAFE